ncbi:exodeoxyribonuclease VII small subunit [Flavonifractor sp. An92]|uniref:exodeoxyribonuclease VII small subunit n=1 Tax=Flavonifractor sp. An92 TaxID=1965666 RepID=UPI000B37ED38|nr:MULTISPECIES: exodeoxyribonuclease VII small subunit [unclassified Flavonifractor]OUN07999.1 exodeoxyribonuclease VII small subunit [Flavonifractor sp. An92]OUQ24670.1 exodeoxyribonuclease VII small subunit [Flavonifractor sp. An135]
MKKRSFEESAQRLEEIVRLLERGDAPLEEAMALFEEGTGLMKTCTTLLDRAEQKVRKLTAAPDGTPVEQAFDGEGAE